LRVWQRKPAEVFCIDADGVYQVKYRDLPNGIAISDAQAKVGIYVAARALGLRRQLEGKRRKLLATEAALGFDPARDDADFKVLESLLVPQ
jgi:hypothetical protein